MFESTHGWSVNDPVVGFSVIIVKEKGHMSVCYREQWNLCFDQMFVKYLRTSQLLMIIIIFGCQSDIDTVIFVSTKIHLTINYSAIVRGKTFKCEIAQKKL